VLENQAKILDDLRLITATPVFQSSTYSANAEALLSQHVSWEGDGIGELSSASHLALIKLFEKYPAWMSSSEKLREIGRDPLLKEIDTGWMARLDHFDHWDISTRTEIKEHLARATLTNGIGKIGIVSALPLPNFDELRKWAIVRFLQSSNKKQSDPITALSAFRKATALCHSAGLLISEMVALRMLQDEKTLVQSFEISNWNLVPDETIQAYKRLSWASVALVRMPWFGDEIPKEFTSFLKPENGMCAGVWESLVGLDGFRDYLEPRFPFEYNFATNMNRARDNQRQFMATCHMGNYESLLTPSPIERQPLFGSDNLPLMGIDWPGTRYFNWSRIPYLRQLVGLQVLAIATPNYLRLYDAKKI
jgi:hypothetical protein